MPSETDSLIKYALNTQAAPRTLGERYEIFFKLDGIFPEPS